MAKSQTSLAAILKKHEDELVKEWIVDLKAKIGAGRNRVNDTELFAQAKEFVGLLQRSVQSGDLSGEGPAWQPIREFLEAMSRSRVAQGFSSDETAIFIFSFKKPLFQRLSDELSKDAASLSAEILVASELLDRMGLMTVRAFQQSREEVINRQQMEMLELSTPVVKLWNGVLALPMIGTLDSARTQIVMESLLQRIVETGSEIAIIDITGVPTVDTLVAQHLLKTVTAIRLMGADCIISGVRPQIAQTIVHLGVDLQGVTTKASLADALAVALKRSGFIVSKLQA
ncbi:MAG TPA: STAS domain-containing protein [Pirellulales bacterium]|nr:STAS domain-containing protein [Pirellulales bacterium]